MTDDSPRTERKGDHVPSTAIFRASVFTLSSKLFVSKVSKARSLRKLENISFLQRKRSECSLNISSTNVWEHKKRHYDTVPKLSGNVMVQPNHFPLLAILTQNYTSNYHFRGTYIQKE